MKLQRIFLASVTIVSLSACSVMMAPNSKKNQASTSQLTGDEGTGGGGDLIGGGANSGAGYGASVTGVGSMTAPTGDAVVQRIRNGLEGAVSPTAANFARSLAQVNTNLPKVSDPLKVTGFDQVELLAYAACSDLTTGNTPLMQTRYQVTKGAAIAAQSTNLINAGVRMLDAHSAGLASTGTAAAAVRTAFTNLVNKVGAVNTNNSTIAFMAVCVAANTAGSSMMGF